MKLFVLVASLWVAGVKGFSPAATFGGTRQQAPTHCATLSMTASNDLPPLATRRSWLSSAGIATSSLVTQVAFPQPSFAAGEKLEMFKDDVHSFEIKVPSNWEKQVQTLPDRRKIIFYVDPANDGTLMFLAYTPIRDDFTSLSSFGSVDQVGEMTILPKGELAGEDNQSKMLKAESKNAAYYFDYTATTPDRPKTHFRTIFSLATVAGAAGATLVTLTAQTPETKYGELKPLFDEIMDSYGKLK